MRSHKGDESRTTNNPKTGRFEICILSGEMLAYCCKVTGKERTDIVRMGIKKVYED